VLRHQRLQQPLIVTVGRCAGSPARKRVMQVDNGPICTHCAASRSACADEQSAQAQAMRSDSYSTRASIFIQSQCQLQGSQFAQLDYRIGSKPLSRFAKLTARKRSFEMDCWAVDIRENLGSARSDGGDRQLSGVSPCGLTVI